MRDERGRTMTRKTRTTVLFIAFTALCLVVIFAGILAVRFTQGTAQDGDGLLLGFLAVFAIVDLLIVRVLYGS